MAQFPLEATLVSLVFAATTPRDLQNQVQLVRILNSHHNVSERHATNVDRRKKSVMREDHASHVRNESCLAMGGAPQQP